MQEDGPALLVSSWKGRPWLALHCTLPPADLALHWIGVTVARTDDDLACNLCRILDSLSGEMRVVWAWYDSEADGFLVRRAIEAIETRRGDGLCATADMLADLLPPLLIATKISGEFVWKKS